MARKGLYFLVLTLTVFSCNIGNSYYDTDPVTGLKYKFFQINDKGQKPKAEDILVLNLSYKTELDSILFDTKDVSVDFRMKMGRDKYEGGSIDDAFSMMHVGDSARFLIDATLFYSVSKKAPVPDFVKPGSKLIFDIKLKEIFDFEKFQEKTRNIDVPDKNEELKLLESFIRNANITVKPEKSGLFYIEELKGKGKSPAKGNKVKIHYTGSFIDGKVFDSSLERNEPYEFTFDMGEVIPGLDEGVGKMKPGGKATLIIPSDLAYGEKKTGRILPFSTLIFEIELLEIKDK